MIAMISGAGAIASSSTSHPFPREMRPLSESGQKALHEISSGKDPASWPPDAHLSKGDIANIFWNSRQFMCLANHARLCNPADAELGARFEMMWNDHAKLRWQIIFSIIESIVGKLGIGQITTYSGLLLWTYGEELELLDQISQKCGLEGTAIQAIL